MNKKYCESMLTLIMVAFLSIGLVSCSKDNDEDNFSLVGSTYAAFAYHMDATEFAGFHYDGYDAYWVYRFISPTQCEAQTREGSPTGRIIGDITTCTYTLDYPTITIKQGNATFIGTFLDKNTFRTQVSGGTMEYIKQ